MATRSSIHRQQPMLRRPSCVSPSAALKPTFLVLARQVAGEISLSAHAPWVLGVTSLRERAGKSTVSFNLAAALAGLLSSPVLLVEANLGPSYALAGRSPQVGFRQVLEGNVTCRECAVRADAAALDVIPSQRVAAGSVDALPWEMLPRIIREQMIDYSCVVFDLPTASHRVFPWLATSLHGLLLVVEPREVQRRAIEQFQFRMAKSEAKLLGLIINKC